jgi:hypothetical protein
MHDSAGAPLKSSLLKAILTDVQFWVPATVLVLAAALLLVLK